MALRAEWLVVGWEDGDGDINKRSACEDKCGGWVVMTMETSKQAKTTRA